MSDSKRTCVRCDHLRNVAVKTPDGVICAMCRQREVPDDGLCPRCSRPGRLLRKLAGVPVCRGCWQRTRPRGTCRECGLPARHTLCPKHLYQHDEARQVRGQCKDCRQENRRLMRGTCSPCSKRRLVTRQLAELFGEPVQHPQLAALVDHLVKYRDPNFVSRWLRQLAPKIVKYLMTAVAGHQLEAEQFLALRSSRGGTFLLECIRQSGCVPLLSLSGRCNRFVSEVAAEASVALRSVLAEYAAYYDQELLRLRPEQRPRSWRLPSGDRLKIQAAMSLLQWCEDARCPLEHLKAGAIEEYLRDKRQGFTRWTMQFVCWLADAGKISFRPPPFKQRYPQSPRLSEQQLSDVLQRALYDEELPLRIRAMLLFIILACRMPADLCALTRDVVTLREPDRVEVRFASGIAQLFDGQAARVITNLVQSDSQWLFPSQSQSGHLAPGTIKWYFAELELPGPRLLHSSGLWEKLKDHSAVELAVMLGKSASWVEYLKQRLNPVDPAHRAYMAQVAAG
jgi:hypothetical protein